MHPVLKRRVLVVHRWHDVDAFANSDSAHMIANMFVVVGLSRYLSIVRVKC